MLVELYRRSIRRIEHIQVQGQAVDRPGEHELPDDRDADQLRQAAAVPAE